MTTLASWITLFIARGGYVGLALAMAVESACIPLPSEIIMPFGGYLASMGRLDLWLVALAGAIGCNLGSILPFELARRGGRGAIRRYGRWLLLTEDDVDRAQRFFSRFGGGAVLIGRLLPGVRSYIALPAGLAQMSALRFHAYTFAGSWPWCLGLAYFGKAVGSRWQSDPRLATVFHRAELAVLIVFVAAVVWFAWPRLKSREAT